MSVPGVRVGLVGCGKISQAYLSAGYPNVTYVACADIDEARAKATAETYHLEALDVSELLSDGDVDVVCNLTVPRAHVEISTAALRNGKHVYLEKPLGLDREEGATVVQLAEEGGLRIGCAPDTFLGAGLQTCRRLIDEGRIGEPLAAMANMVSHGPEHWHPDPAFYYQRGAGPLFDMGPYYLTALVTLLGPISRVAGLSSGAGVDRRVRSGPRANRDPPGRDRHSYLGPARVRQRSGGYVGHQFRRLGFGAAPPGNPRDRGQPVPSGPEHFRWPGATFPGGGQRMGGDPHRWLRPSAARDRAIQPGRFAGRRRRQPGQWPAGLPRARCHGQRARSGPKGRVRAADQHRGAASRHSAGCLIAPAATRASPRRSLGP